MNGLLARIWPFAPVNVCSLTGMPPASNNWIAFLVTIPSIAAGDRTVSEPGLETNALLPEYSASEPNGWS
ncbi:hypothetical protein D3C80_1659590 [compost metagenome]